MFYSLNLCNLMVLDISNLDSLILQNFYLSVTLHCNNIGIRNHSLWQRLNSFLGRNRLEHKKKSYGKAKPFTKLVEFLILGLLVAWHYREVPKDKKEALFLLAASIYKK